MKHPVVKLFILSTLRINCQAALRRTVGAFGSSLTWNTLSLRSNFGLFRLGQFTTAVDNLSLAASQKQNLRGMAGITNFPQTIPVHDVKTWEFMEFQSALLMIFTVHNENQKYDTEYIYSAVAVSLKQFLIRMQYKKLPGGQMHKIQLH